MATLTLFSAFQDARRFTFVAASNEWVETINPDNALPCNSGSTMPAIASAEADGEAEVGYLICRVTHTDTKVSGFLRITLAHNLLFSGSAGSAVGAMVTDADAQDIARTTGWPGEVLDDVIGQVTYGLNEGRATLGGELRVTDYGDDEDTEHHFHWHITDRPATPQGDA